MTVPVYTNLDHHLLMAGIVGMLCSTPRPALNYLSTPEYSIRLLENTTLNYINGTELGLSYTDIFYIIMQRVVQVRH